MRARQEEAEAGVLNDLTWEEQEVCEQDMARIREAASCAKRVDMYYFSTITD